jgi:hypothetical protein
MTDNPPTYTPHPRRLEISVIASTVVVAVGLVLPFFRYINFPLSLLLLGAAFCGAICGAFCGITVLFSLRGFHRLVAVLSSLVSFYALIQSVGFMHSFRL